MRHIGDGTDDEAIGVKAKVEIKISNLRYTMA